MRGTHTMIFVEQRKIKILYIDSHKNHDNSKSGNRLFPPDNGNRAVVVDVGRRILFDLLWNESLASVLQDMDLVPP